MFVEREGSSPEISGNIETDPERRGFARRTSDPPILLRQLTTQDGVYVGLRYGLGILIGLANMFVLTWWIGPHAYGLFVTAIGLSSFLGNLSRGGADTYLVRRDRPPDRRLYRVATTLIAGNSALLVLLGLGAVPVLIRWFGNREFIGPYLATLITIPLVGLAGPPIAKLERELDFRSAAGIELSGQLLALVVSVFLAYHHFGVWAPVAGVIAWQGWVAVVACMTARLAPGLAFDKGEVRAMLSFGLGYTLSLRVWQLRALVNPLLVGRLVGAEGVAFVALAVRVGESLGFVRIAAGRLAVAGLSRLRSEPERLRSALQRGLELQVFTLGPLLCLFALGAPWLVPTVFGLRWTPSLEVYPWVAAAVLINSVFNLQASALFVLGQPWTVFRAYCVHVVLFGFGTLILVSQNGIGGYGWADLSACAAYTLIYRRLGLNLQISYRRLVPWCFAFCATLFSVTSALVWRWTLRLPLALLMFLGLWTLLRQKRGARRPIVQETLQREWGAQRTAAPTTRPVEISSP